METFVEVVRRGIENRNELSVTYTVPSRSDEDGEQADRDSEDLPDLMPIRDGEAVTPAAARTRHGTGRLPSHGVAKFVNACTHKILSGSNI